MYVTGGRGGVQGKYGHYIQNLDKINVWKCAIYKAAVQQNHNNFCLKLDPDFTFN